MATVASLLFDADLAVERIIWLPGCSARANDMIKSVLWDDPQDIVKAIGMTFVLPDNDEDVDVDEFMSEVYNQGKHGFLVEVATPVAYYDNPDDTSYRSSWGHYHTGWLYTEAFDEAFVEKIQKWAEECREKDRQKAKTGG